MSEFSSLPGDFVWGAATSAYQIEGAVTADGRRPSIWDTFCRVPGAIDNGDTGEVACDSYRRWPEDLDLIRQLGLDSYRFSVAWPRVLPTVSGAVNAAGLDHYDRMVDDLLAAGVKPLVTLYHWDLPQDLQDAGGWPNRDTAHRFADYAAIVAQRLGDRVRDWVTLNEPLCSAWIGHLEGKMAPGIKDVGRAVPAAVHLLLAHGLGAEAIRANATAAPSLGLVLNLSPCEPASDSEADVAAAVRADGHTNRWWLDPIHGRGFPADMVDVYGVELPLRDGDLATIATPLDYLGVNYYFRFRVRHDDAEDVVRFRQVPVPGARTTSMGWEVHAAGLEELLLRVTKEYGVAAIQVTESGSAWHDTPVERDGVRTVPDPDRTRYLEEHIAAVNRAVAQGAPVSAYYAWSLLDNFEWAYGYWARFGLVHVDFATGTRTMKQSGHRYAELIRSHRDRPTR
jgi:beta-glucosidase